MTKIQKDNKNVAKVPNLRFTEFTEEWETKKLGEIGEIVNGLTYSPNDIAENGVLVLRSSNVQNRSLAFEDNVYVRTDNYNPVQENDILICVRNGSKNLIGKNALINKENEGIAFGAFMSIYRSSFNRFLFHWFDTNEYKEIVHKNLGATINSINGSDLRKFKVPFPSVEEQNKLASFLSRVDERIQTQNKIIEQLETLIKGICQILILNQVPNKKINNCVSCYSSSLTESDVIDKNGNHPVYGATGVIAFTENPQINEDAILIIKDGSGVGKVQYGSDKFSVIGTLNYLTAKSNINLKYVFFCLKFFNFDKYKVGSGIPHIYFKDYGESLIFCPSLDEQGNIEELLSLIDEKINIEKTLLKKYEIQKKNLLQNLFI
ncbi:MULTISPECIES: restriction endonuclease subunit S [unclassified Empedobacter]|uniref:restriction endonuclease subunit S n=1 Tax=unclassified Empedobacter TaxID=2643773 RepID=UPI0025B9646C|nr:MULTISPECIES: restriction endonuclease subunit S [unclassified Empedobacter]